MMVTHAFFFWTFKFNYLESSTIKLSAGLILLELKKSGGNGILSLKTTKIGLRPLEKINFKNMTL